MGLDSVELLMAVEEEFGVEIPYATCGGLYTVGQLVDHVYAAVNGVDQERGQAEWAKLDALYMKVVGREVSGLPVETKIVDLLDSRRECRQWEELGIRGEVARPRWLVRVILMLSGVAGLVSFAFFFPPPSMAFAAAGLAFTLVLVGLLLATVGMRQIPDRERTLGDEIWWKTAPADPQLPREEVFERVLGCIVRQLAVEAEDVQEDSRFVEDLRMD